MPAAQEIHRLQAGERRRPDLAPVGPVGAVRHQVEAKLALGRPGRCVDHAGGMMVLAVELEMVNGRFHRALHLGAQRLDTSTVSFGARSPPIFQCKRRLSSKWSSISEPPRRSVSTFLYFCSSALARG